MSRPIRLLGMLLATTFVLTIILPAQEPTDDQSPAPAVADQPSAASGAEPSSGEPVAAASGSGNSGAASTEVSLGRPMVCLIAGVATVLGLIIFLKVNAFIALISAAMLVSLLAPGPLGMKMARVGTAFGGAAGNIGIVIALAAVIGTCLLDSGAADRIVRSFLKLLGEKRAPMALMGSGFVLAVPVFFDTVFYLLVPLARSLHRTTGKQYLKYILAIAAGGAITHTLVPPTPGPLVMASNLNIDIGVMMMIGFVVALPGAVAGLIFSGIADRLMPIPMRQLGSRPERPPLKDDELPSFWLSVLPVALPVVLISSNTFLRMINPESPLADYTGVIGNPNFALLLSTVIALWVLVKQQNLSLMEAAAIVETSLMSGGVIILITAGGGAFGAMLSEAQVGDAIKAMFADVGGAQTMVLLLGFGIAAVLKVAQGSSTVAMITGSSMLAGIAAPETLGFHPVYLATAIGGGSLVGSWMNDSGFWIFAKMGGLTEVEALKSWTIMLVVLGVVSLAMTLLMVQLLPMAPG